MLLFVLTFVFLDVINGRIFDASANVNAFMKAQKNLVEGVENYIRYEEKRLIDLNKSSGYEDEIPIVQYRIGNLTKFYEELKKNYTSVSDEQRMKTADHPITLYHVIKNFVANWIPKLSYKYLYGKRFFEFLNISENLLPDYNDVISSKKAILQIQMTYNISTKELLQGNLSGHQVEPLSWADAYDIGVFAVLEGMARLGMEWLQLAVDEYEREPNQTTFPVTEAYSKLSLAFHMLNKFDKAEELLEKAHHINETDMGIYKLYIQYRNGKVPFSKTYQDPFWWGNYSTLCNASHTVPKLRWYHRCRYRCARDVGSFPLYREEILSVTPFISYFHDVISEKEADELLLEAAKKITNTTETFNNEWRKTAYLSDLNQKAKNVFSAITKVTGLLAKIDDGGTQNMQIMNFGLGGQHLPHIDINLATDLNILDSLHKINKRTATILIDLSDAEGGATVFTQLGIRVYPKKGSALFWYNYKPDGRPEILTPHGACPVMSGQKWTVRSWIWETGNEERRPCGKHSNSTQFGVERVLFPQQTCRFL